MDASRRERLYTDHFGTIMDFGVYNVDHDISPVFVRVLSALSAVL
jgi:hypothetical protein